MKRKTNLRGAETPPDVVVEQLLFERVLDLECRRCERSGSRLALALIDFTALEGRNDDQLGDVASHIAQAMRETDVTGWYRAPAILGVILTTINGGNRSALEVAMKERIRDPLARRLTSEDIDGVHVSCHFFPDEKEECFVSGQGRSTFSPSSRPSAGKRGSASIKRAVDIAGSLTALLMLGPLFVAVAILIKGTSPGPVFFRQTRVGQFGRRFTLLKFRSMFSNSDPQIHEEFVGRFIDRKVDDSEGVYKIRNDPRVTPLGRILRKASVDELPQFLNVLRGDMSLVGPRPPIPYELAKYSPWHLRRIQDAKPGITGAWQVYGRSRTTFDEMVRMDLRYIQSRTLWLDLKILLRTPIAVLGGDGAH